MSKLIPTPPDMLEIRDLPGSMLRQPDQLPEIPGGWTERVWIIEGHSFRMTLPAVPDAFLEEPEVHEAFDRDGYMPYWAFLWPAALKMAATILNSDWPANANVLEIGAGVGIVSLAGFARSLNVTVSDYEPKAVELALYNARQNGFEQGHGLVLDWRIPPSLRYSHLWGCEVLYEQRHHKPLLNLTRQVLAADGVAWFADGGRTHAERFCNLAKEYGLRFQLFDENLQPLAVPRIGRYQLIEVRHQCP